MAEGTTVTAKELWAPLEVGEDERTDSPLSFQKECSPSNILVLAQQDPLGTPEP